MTTANKTIQIKEITDGQAIHDLFLVREMSRGETKAGKPYLSLVLMDASGEISGRVWENAEQLMGECPTGAIVSVTGQAQAYKGILQLRVDNLSRIAESEVDLALFVPSVQGNVGLMAKELLKLAGSVENPFLKELLLALFGERRLMQAFKKAPAAKVMHHAYVGGLLEHTLAVARLADSISTLYPNLDRSSGFPEELGDRIKHLILSHHGRHEFGSPSLPMMQEAFALNFLDDLDAKINYLDRLAGQVKGEGYQWTEFQRNLERFLFVKGHRADDGSAASLDQGQDNGVDPRQRTLFGL
ncbi:MAG: OB-fold nucleic acid binding domain-containing protein [Deltaproteobacteria bacterium]|nr:OB-fold nucleic acid binding domain-containing protein [Deltaproteobacteria bacterium]